MKSSYSTSWCTIIAIVSIMCLCPFNTKYSDSWTQFIHHDNQPLLLFCPTLMVFKISKYIIILNKKLVMTEAKKILIKNSYSWFSIYCSSRCSNWCICLAIAITVTIVNVKTNEKYITAEMYEAVATQYATVVVKYSTTALVQ